jgi:hypothetical protein
MIMHICMWAQTKQAQPFRSFYQIHHNILKLIFLNKDSRSIYLKSKQRLFKEQCKQYKDQSSQRQFDTCDANDPFDNLVTN